VTAIKDTRDIIARASEHLASLEGHTFDVLTITKPVTINSALNLAKVISKLSPLLGNLIEFNTVEILNDQQEFSGVGKWVRQDPGFPDTVFIGDYKPTPGFEIKAWFPLATEITARFRDSQNHFVHDNTYVAMLAWLPEHIIYGKPKIIGVCVVSGQSVAAARDTHYHKPPDYLVLEPEDTSTRTRNLQQTNTSGHKWQGTLKEFAEADTTVTSWGPTGRQYQPTEDYQKLLRRLTSKYKYRLDTNFAKMDRIIHADIERFKTATLDSPICGIRVKEWARLLSGGMATEIANELETRLGIKEGDAETILK
jgi:hypothetical protein